jgi:hypothetical protein
MIDIIIPTRTVTVIGILTVLPPSPSRPQP